MKRTPTKSNKYVHTIFHTKKTEIMETKFVRVMRKFNTFNLVEELWYHPEIDSEPTRMESYRSKEGYYIDCRFRKRRPRLMKVITRLEISPEPVDKKKGEQCSIGKSAVDGKWYGWTHRGMAGFGKGDRIFQQHYTKEKLCKSCREGVDCEGEPCPSSVPFIRHGEKEIKTDTDARKAAVAFMQYIS